MTASVATYDRSGTHAGAIAHGWLEYHDAAALRYMRAQLHQHVQQNPIIPNDGRVPITYLPEPDGRQHRVVLVNAAALVAKANLTFVAFFGHKRADLEPGLLDALDHELIHEFIGYPQLLSYSSLELSDGSWGNLVLMSGPEGIAHWAESQRHAYAAREVAPTCYHSIRLHRGMLSAGITPDGGVEFQRTKLFSFA